MRHSVFHGLRADKLATAIERKQPMRGSVASDALPPVTSLPAGAKVSSPDRAIEASSGATRIDVVRCDALIAPLRLPYSKRRPVSLVRAPDGTAGSLFFQKHLEKYKLPGLRELDAALDRDHGR